MDEWFELRETAGRGLGVYSKRRFKCDEIVMTGRIERYVDGNSKHASQIAEDTFVVHAGLVPMVNHSCDPNCGIRVNRTGAHDYIAIRDIEIGEEIVFDYAMRNYRIEFFPERCLCGAETCRGSMTGWKDLPSDLKKAYAPYAAPYLITLEKKRPQTLGSESISSDLPENRDLLFDFPVGVYGNSSGWCPERGVDLFRHPDLAARRLLDLRSCARAAFIPIEHVSDAINAAQAAVDQVGTFPVFVKAPCSGGTDNDFIPAISSGAGSAIFRTCDGDSYKVKRCGVGDWGFADQNVRGNYSVLENGEFYDYSGLGRSGLMSLGAALEECSVASKLAELGLTRAYTPLGIAIFDDPAADTEGANAEQVQKFAAVISKVESDLRIDELVYAAMTPMISEFFAEKKVSYDPSYPAWGMFDSDGVPLIGSRQRWRIISDRLHEIGIVVGAAYGRCHDAGILRGLGSAWFGNEVIHPDGHLSFVDFDGGTTDLSHVDADTETSLKNTEMHQFCMESYLLLQMLRPRTFKLFGADFVEGVWQGYGQDYRPMSPDLVSDIIEDHFQNIAGLWQGMGFSDDIATPASMLPGCTAEITFDDLRA